MLFMETMAAEQRFSFLSRARSEKVEANRVRALVRAFSKVLPNWWHENRIRTVVSILQVS